MAKKPAPLIMGLIDGDAVDPGLEAALAPEMPDVAEDFEKNFLHHVRRIAWVARQAESQVVDRLLEPREQGFVGGLFAGAQPANQFVILAALFDRAGITRCVFREPIRIQAEH